MNTQKATVDIKHKLTALAKDLVNQRDAKVLIDPMEHSSGFWFGGGNVIEINGAFYLVGRYRNYGDSTTGLAKGTRGLELAIFRSDGFFRPFEKVKSFTKSDLSRGTHKVLSVEGTSLLSGPRGVELFLSTEKEMPYPEPVSSFRKPGTGVWTIDMLAAPTVEQLDSATITNVVAPGEPSRLHVKDPVVFHFTGGNTVLVYCTHPFSWASTNTSAMLRTKGGSEWTKVTDRMMERGNVWDVAVVRVTDRMPVPRLGEFADLPPTSLYFYDGCECARPHEENPAAVTRPRGYSCEELSGVAWGFDSDFPAIERLSVNAPLFTSPYGTRCSRYTSTLVTESAIYTSWQQSQEDFSQPLVGYALPMETVEMILRGTDR